MDCLLIFDHLNDIVYTKYNNKFVEHITESARKHGLIENDEPNPKDIDKNVIVQLFSPIITSHRIMNCQFGNSYTSIQCQEGLNMLFDDYMGYLFVSISGDDVTTMKRSLHVSVTIVRYLCGPDVDQLKSNEDKAALASKLINSWHHLYSTEQFMYIEAIEQLIINPDLSSATIEALRDSLDRLTAKIDCNKVHALVLVHNKFLSLYSSQNAKELSAADVLFCTILCHTSRNAVKETSKMNLYSYQVLLSGPDAQPKCLPHQIHILQLDEGVELVYLVEVGNAAVAASLYETFCHLHAMQLIQIQRDKEILQPAFDNLDLATRKLNDSLKKCKNKNVEACHKQLVRKWEVIKKKYVEFLKNGSDEALLRAETLNLGFLENLKEMLSLTAIDDKTMVNSGRFMVEAGRIVQNKLKIFDDFLKAKGLRNFSLGSDSLTIKKYLEEFPGLVHFLYVDRTSHRVTMPTMEPNLEETAFTADKVWSMVKFARNYLQEGNMALMWKDTVFNYAYFVWFEDNSGAPLKPTVFPAAHGNNNNALPLPGILCQDFYTKLKEVCFPKMAPNKIKCYELFCIHLGLVTAQCVLEQTRRLSASIWELKGHPNHPIDLI